MEKIERPITIEKVGIMMHLAEYFLSQVIKILLCIEIAPNKVTPAPIYERVTAARTLAQSALDALLGKTDGTKL